MKIKTTAYDNKTGYEEVSDEVYEIVDNSHAWVHEKYSAGCLVRIVKRKHDTQGWVIVTPYDSDVCFYGGIPQDKLRIVK